LSTWINYNWDRVPSSKFYLR